tara:strand:+ start:2653 stop:2835 length:183 start_codon:yes stop_codon:yes gene_type:complete
MGLKTALLIGTVLGAGVVSGCNTNPRYSGGPADDRKGIVDSGDVLARTINIRDEARGSIP